MIKKRRGKVKRRRGRIFELTKIYFKVSTREEWFPELKGSGFRKG